MSKYLDYNGLLYFKQKLDNLFETKAVVASKIDNPETKSQGQILTYNGTGWVAQDAPDTGVVTFNGRDGEVSPADGDYSADMITYGSSDVDSALDSLNSDVANVKAVNGIIKGNGSGTYVAAVAGVDYQVPVVFNTAYDSTSNKAATMTDINNAISTVTTFSFHICTSSEYDPTTRIPTITSPSSSTIYLIPKATAGTNQSYVEWAYISNAWEVIGDTQISVESISNSEIDTLFS